MGCGRGGSGRRQHQGQDPPKQAGARAGRREVAAHGGGDCGLGLQHHRRRGAGDGRQPARRGGGIGHQLLLPQHEPPLDPRGRALAGILGPCRIHPRARGAPARDRFGREGHPPHGGRHSVGGGVLAHPARGGGHHRGLPAGPSRRLRPGHRYRPRRRGRSLEDVHLHRLAGGVPRRGAPQRHIPGRCRSRPPDAQDDGAADGRPHRREAEIPQGGHRQHLPLGREPRRQGLVRAQRVLGADLCQGRGHGPRGLRPARRRVGPL
mmetsp:Transcript_14901/g.35498  ORF Transcript_14901/g.35498 Transcript_14901/m.35498 type:complete len:264 (-) Transcript_14901:506-1297(-)